jgi:hypothetical protein
MNKLFCTNCGNSVIASIRICPNCGSRSFSETAPIKNGDFEDDKIEKQLGTPNSIQNQTPVTTSSISPVNKKERWYEKWFVVAIGYVCLFKLFGLFGAIAGIATYAYLKPKKGFLIAIGASIAIATLVGVGAIILIANM